MMSGQLMIIILESLNHPSSAIKQFSPAIVNIQQSTINTINQQLPMINNEYPLRHNQINYQNQQRIIDHQWSFTKRPLVISSVKNNRVLQNRFEA